MKRQLSLLAVALLLAQPVLAKDIPLNRAAALANSVTPAASSQAYDDLEQQALAQLRHALQGNAATLTRDRLARTKQNQTQADTAWLKASGYDFQTRANQQAGIALLSAFSTLPETVVKQNLATVTAINRDAVQTTRRQALADAEGISYLYFLSDALGPRLGKAFLTAYDQGALGKAAALIKASEVSTGEAKKHFNNPRPFLVQGNTIHLVPDDVVVKDNQPYTANGGSLPQRPHQHRLYRCAAAGGDDPGALRRAGGARRPLWLLAHRAGRPLPAGRDRLANGGRAQRGPLS